MGQERSDKPQVDKFREAARELGADESEDAFNDKLRQIAKSPPPQGGSEGKKPKTKKPGQ